MSHFTVLVTGEDIDSALAPFIEQEEAGSEQFFTFNIETTAAELQAEWESDIANGELTDSYETLEEYVENYYGYQTDGNGNYGYIKNNNAKWDWYQLGGRWSGMLKLKSGVVTPSLGMGIKEGYADSVLKKDIDIDGMRNEAMITAKNYAEPFFNALVGIKMLISWDSIKESTKDINIARERYNNQEVIKAIRNVEKYGYFDNLFDNCRSFDEISTHAVFSREDVDTLLNEYIEFRKNTCLQTFAFLHEGIWSEKGEMGWWGVVSNEKEKTTWEEGFTAFFDSLSDDTRINIVDCHI